MRRHEVAQSDAILSMDTVFCQAILRQLWRQIMWLGELTRLVHGADRQHFRKVGAIASAQLRRHWVIPCGTRDGNPEAVHVRLYAHNHVSASLATPTSGSIAPVGAFAVDSH